MADIQIARETAAVAMSYTLAPGFSFELIEARLKFNAAPTTNENFTITVSSGVNAVYNAVPCDYDMAGFTTFIFPTGDIKPLHFAAGDSLVFAYNNTDTKTYGLEIRYRRLT